MNEFRASASMDVLKRRAALLAKTRGFFDARGFFEVQTPVLSADTVVDRHIDPIPVLLPRDAYSPLEGRRLWLQTSPEFAMKRLLASGAEAIYQIGPAFRVGESGQQHNPEFTILEWYRCGDTAAEGIALLADFITSIFGMATLSISTIQDAFILHAGFDPFCCSAEELRNHCAAAQVSAPATIGLEDWNTWFDLLFSSLVQPQLGRGTIQVIRDFPASQAALARIRQGTPSVAERFELFIEGVELANGYHELLDPQELRRRTAINNAERLADGKQSLPTASRLLTAMQAGLPACTGVAVGFDRVVMLDVGAQSIDEVLAFPIDRA